MYGRHHVAMLMPMVGKNVRNFASALKKILKQEHKQNVYSRRPF